MSPQRLLPRTSLMIAAYLLVVIVAASAALYFANERTNDQQRADSERLRAVAVAQCERVNVRVDAVINALKIVTEGSEAPQSDIGVRLFAAIDALQQSKPGDCTNTIP